MVQLGHGMARKEKEITYEGAQVWRSNLRNHADIEAFEKLALSQVISLWALKWHAADYLVHAHNQKRVLLALKAGGLDYSVLIPDVQKIIDDLREPPPDWNENTLRIGHRLSWKSYPRLNVINEYLDYLTKNYPSLCTVSTLGYSVEKRPIQMLSISNGDARNKIIMVTGGIHAREWIAITSSLYLINTIVTNFDNLPSFMKYVDWRIVPVLNPDGYEYSHTTDRLWRKNRRKFENSGICAGVDLNRNFGPHWYIPGVSKNCCICDGQYPGSHPFSEPETMAIRDYLLRSGRLPHAFVDVHAYGQLIMYPWGYTADSPKNGPYLNSVAEKMSKAIMQATGRNYIFGDTYHTVYQASGIQMDWFLSKGVELSYTIELRDSLWGPNNNKENKNWNTMGFLLPAEYIKPTGEDLVTAVNILTRTVANMTNKLLREHGQVDIVFGYEFALSVGNNQVCYDNFSGYEPYSEPETRAIRNFIQASQKLPSAYIDLHSYGQFIVYPWSSKATPAHNKDILHAVAAKMTKAIFTENGAEYKYGDVYHTMYQARGTQLDWIYSLGVKFCFGFEMRSDKDILGFLLPTDYIEPTGKDLIAAMKVLAAIIKTHEGVTKGPAGVRERTIVFEVDLNLNVSLGLASK